MPSPKNRIDFLRCQMCKHCYDHKCRDVSQMTIKHNLDYSTLIILTTEFP